MSKGFDQNTNDYGFAPQLAEDMRRKGVDLPLTAKVLTRFNEGQFDHIVPIEVKGIPVVDGETVIDMTGDLNETFTLHTAQENIDRLGLEIDLTDIGQVDRDQITFDRNALAELGVRLYPVLGYGVLNGGSASSYFDHKKNEAFDPKVYEICRSEFEVLEQLGKDNAKGLAPAFINEDKTPGPSFIELKMRALLVEILRYQALENPQSQHLLPFFQMTSIFTHDELAEAYQHYRESIWLNELIAATGVDVTEVHTRMQPMLAAFSHSSQGKSKTLFTNAWNKENNILAMPGGHGQNFEILQEIYRNFLAQGIKYVYLGNVDNLGFTVDPVSLALVALKNKQAGFDFAFRTAVDVKGGILVIDQRKRMNCADIGPAISKEAVLAAEGSGKKILFNCATGLFDLEYLVNRLDDIKDNLPVRFSDQDKDAGKYSQAEQVTWEIIGMLDDFLIFGIDKYDRFLAAKIALESLMASGVGLERADYPTDPNPASDLKKVALELHQGLSRKLATTYGAKKEGRRWVPQTVGELRAGFFRLGLRLS